MTHSNGRHKNGAGTLPAESLDDTPRAALVLCDESAWVVRFDRGTPAGWTPVATEAAASALAVFGADTGLLPDGILFWQRRSGRDRVGVWLPPARRRLDFGERRQVVTVPMPGLVFVGQGTSYQVWAARARPDRPGAALFHAPLPNVYDDARVCNGSVNFPKATGGTILAAAKLFFESGFSRHLADGRVLGKKGATDFLLGLNGKRAFPLESLAPAGMAMGQVLGGDKKRTQPAVAGGPDVEDELDDELEDEELEPA